jgi:hypothetical protein
MLVDGVMDCFYLLAIVDSATVNVGIKLPIQDAYLRVELLGLRIVILCLASFVYALFCFETGSQYVAPDGLDLFIYSGWPQSCHPL